MQSRRLAIYNWLIAPLPFTRLLSFKIWWLKRCGIKIGARCAIEPNVLIFGSGMLEIGEEVTIAKGVCIECNGCIKIGDRVEVNCSTLLSAYRGATLTIEDDVHVAHQVSLKCSTHKVSLSGPSIAGQSQFRDITIHSGCWLCAGCIILPGVTIGKRNVIAAGAVVTSDTLDNVLMAGVPATVKKKYV